MLLESAPQAHLVARRQRALAGSPTQRRGDLDGGVSGEHDQVATGWSARALHPPRMRLGGNVAFEDHRRIEEDLGHYQPSSRSASTASDKVSPSGSDSHSSSNSRSASSNSRWTSAAGRYGFGRSTPAATSCSTRSPSGSGNWSIASRINSDS